MANKITVDGLEAATALLGKYAAPELTKLLTKATKTGATAFRKPIRQETPVDTGNLAKKISVRKARRTPDAHLVGPKSRYSHLVVGGTKPHRIKARRVGGVLFFGGRMVPEVMHPGAAPNDFVERGFHRGRRDAESKMTAVLADPLKEATRRG